MDPPLPLPPSVDPRTWQSGGRICWGAGAGSLLPKPTTLRGARYTLIGSGGVGVGVGVGMGIEWTGGVGMGREWMGLNGGEREEGRIKHGERRVFSH